MNTKRIWYSTQRTVTSPDAIHQILMFGSLKEIRSLKKRFGENQLKKLFLQHPKKIYTVPAFKFIKDFILNISTPVDEQKYLKYTPRVTG